MRKAASISIALHVAVFVLGYFGLPLLSRDVMMEVPIMIEVVEVSDITNAPQKKSQPKHKPKPKPESEKAEEKPAPPKHEQKQFANKAPPPPPPPAPEPEVAVVAPQAKPEPKAKAKPKPKEKPKAKSKPKASAVLARAKPSHKPKPPETFDSVLKTVANLKQTAAAEEKKKKKDKPKPTFEEEIAKALITKKRGFDSEKPLTISEIDFVRQQIAKCWNLPAGAKNAENMIIEIGVAMNPDGTVRDARVHNSGLQSDPFLRAMAESALRAVLNRRCQPFKLPRDKFDRWKTMTLIFNPKEMFGT
ncbi:MAG: energy transducer TonB family protein [Alphaproteobacteria bacterium]